jgi:hypothetical protein
MIGTIMMAVTSKIMPMFFSREGSNRDGSGSAKGVRTMLMSRVIMLGGSFVSLL